MNDLKVQSPTSIGFFNAEGFALLEKVANTLCNSTLVPAAYRSFTTKKQQGGGEVQIPNPSATSNAIVALNMAQRMGADPLMVMQNLYIVEGRPAWSSQWIIAAINSCGRFSPLRFEITTLGKKTVNYTVTEWVNNQKRNSQRTAEITDKQCVAWAIEKETGARIESPAVSIEMAVQEGWYGKNGSKWQTMDEVMLRYRTASFFGKLYAPELLMGLQTAEEVEDIIERDITAEVERKPVSMPKSKSKAAENIEHDAEPTQARDAAQHEEPEQEYDPETGEVIPPKFGVKAAQEAPADGQVTLSESQLRVIRSQLQSAGVDEQKAAAQFSCEKLEQVPASMCNALLQWIKANKVQS